MFDIIKIKGLHLVFLHHSSLTTMKRGQESLPRSDKAPRITMDKQIPDTAPKSSKCECHDIDKRIYRCKVARHYNEFKPEWCGPLDRLKDEEDWKCPCRGEPSEHFKYDDAWIPTLCRIGPLDSFIRRRNPLHHQLELVFLNNCWYWVELRIPLPPHSDSWANQFIQEKEAQTMREAGKRCKKVRLFVKVENGRHDNDDKVDIIIHPIHEPKKIIYKHWVTKAFLCTHVDTDKCGVF